MIQNVNLHSLKTELAEWQDYDRAGYVLACVIGIIPHEDGKYIPITSVKYMFWSANELGEELVRILQQLARVGVLQDDSEEQKFRWNPNFTVEH
ncbi:MAG: hypothetical protein JWR26_892 [Pedosphaera sp.]|nr:hypothetical protein [Pedosphaera sp.]